MPGAEPIAPVPVYDKVAGTLFIAPQTRRY